jgi:hypothetical protein
MINWVISSRSINSSNLAIFSFPVVICSCLLSMAWMNKSPMYLRHALVGHPRKHQKGCHRENT